MPLGEDSTLFKASIVLGVSLFAGLVVGGFLLGFEIKEIKLADRSVTVKGLVERTVKSDSAIWPLSFEETGDDLPQVFARSQVDKEAVIKFLAGQGFAVADFAVGQIQVTDRLANQFANNTDHGNRYIVGQTVTLHSHDVDKVARTAARSADLVQQGVVLDNNNGQSSVAYKFTGLNALKPDMITEATRNARASASRFAADSGSQVGSIRSANQGVFSITALDATTVSAVGEDGAVSFGNDQQTDASIMKKVRVVSTIEYYLVK